MAREHDTHSLIDETLAAFGGLDILVNNAGIMPAGSVLTQTIEEWDQVMAINVKGIFLCARAAQFLASDDAAFVTGSSLFVDGGLSIAKGNPT